MSAEQLEFIKLLITEITVMSPLIVAIFLVINGIKCLLRSEMMRIYKEHKKRKSNRRIRTAKFYSLIQGL